MLELSFHTPRGLFINLESWLRLVCALLWLSLWASLRSLPGWSLRFRDRDAAGHLVPLVLSWKILLCFIVIICIEVFALSSILLSLSDSHVSRCFISLSLGLAADCCILELPLTSGWVEMILCLSEWLQILQLIKSGVVGTEWLLQQVMLTGCVLIGGSLFVSSGRSACWERTVDSTVYVLVILLCVLELAVHLTNKF